MAGTWQPRPYNYAGIPGVDPCIEWALAANAGRIYFFGLGPQDHQWMPVLVALNGITPREFEQAAEFSDHGDGNKYFLEPKELEIWRSSVRVPSMYYEAVPPALLNLGHCTAFVREPMFKVMKIVMEKYEDKRLLEVVTRVTLGLPLHASSLPKDFAPAPPTEPSPLPDAIDPDKDAKVVIGVVDDAIAFAHERFRQAAGGTRVKFAWLQDGAHPPIATPFLYGAELTQAGINALIANATHGGVVDEDELYQRAGLVDFTAPGHKSAAWRVAHGTHVLDQMGGEDPSRNRLDRPIVSVQLPIATTADTSGATLDPYMIHAMFYILLRAFFMSPKPFSPLALVINFSYGTLAGPHDGTSHREQAMDALVKGYRDLKGRIAVTLPAGNAHLSRCHAEIRFKTLTELRALHWRVLPDDHTPSQIQVWMPCACTNPPPSRLTLQITSPDGGTTSPAIPALPGAVHEWVNGAGRVIAQIVYVHVPAPTNRGMYCITIAPTFGHNPNQALAPSGTWRIDFSNELLSADEPVQVWIERDESLHGHPIRGRQSYFDETCYRRFDHAGRPKETDDPDCHVLRAGLLNAIATGEEPVVIGGMLRKEMQPAPYSAGGPVTIRCGRSTPTRDGPDALAVSDDSWVHRGVLGAGSRSGSLVAMSGTSVAAPQIARFLADQMAAGAGGTRQDVQDEANAQEGIAVPPPKKPRWGEGRIFLNPLHPRRRYFSE